MLVHNWRLKLSALGLSVLLWALVQTEPANQETITTVPVRVQVTDSAWTTAAPPSPVEIQVGFAGPPREIIRLARERTTILVPVSSVGPPDTVITLRRGWVQLGERPGVSVESLSPPEVRVSFEPAETRLLPVATRIVGEVSDDLALAADIDVSPRLVRVRGPASRMETLDSVPLQPFDLSEVEQSGAFAVPVDTTVLDASSVVPQTATLDVRVEALVERVLEGIPVEAEVAAGEEEVVVEPSTIQVRLSGARSLVTSLDPERIRIRLSSEMLDGMQPGEERVFQIRVEGVPELVSAVPETERVRVRRAVDQDEIPGPPASP